MNQSMPQLVHSSESENSSETPNVLIYFPPPMNFLVYYSLKNQSSSSEKPELTPKTTNIASNKRTIDLTGNKNPLGEDAGELAENEKKTDNTSKSEDKLENVDDHKELYFIRKIIRELMEYWQEKEKMSKTSESGVTQQGAAGSEERSTTADPSTTTPVRQN